MQPGKVLKNAAFRAYVAITDFFSELDDLLVKGYYAYSVELGKGIVFYRKTSSGIDYRISGMGGRTVASGTERFLEGESLENLVIRVKMDANRSLRE